MELKFEFGKFTEITDLVFELRPDYTKEEYARFFICPDVNDFWLIRILKNTNEMYERDEGCYLMERDNIAKEYKSEKLTLERVKDIILDDCGECWDSRENYDLQDLIRDLDEGFGILNLKEEN